jgi:hypothetical protein
VTFFYLSFCDVERPKGQQFIGATVVEAEDEEGAIERATALGINPGGEAAIVRLTCERLPEDRANYLDRLVPREEVMADGEYVEAAAGDFATGVVCQDCNPVKR